VRLGRIHAHKPHDACHPPGQDGAALATAVQHDYSNIVDLLLHAGAKPTARALALAVERKSELMVRQLLRFAAPVRDVSVMLTAVKNQVVEVLSQVCPLRLAVRHWVDCRGNPVEPRGSFARRSDQ
jgi:hypothetical protein